jgi:DNA-binding LacI/PurR family transcriptional regulator
MVIKNKKQYMTPIWLSVYDALVLELKNFKCGDRFYSLQDICDTYHVSKITARRAISELVMANLIRTAPRRGAFVIQNNKPIVIYLVHNANLSGDNAFFLLMTERCVKGISEETAKLNIEIKVVSEEIIPNLCQKLSKDDPTGFLILEKINKKNLSCLNEYKQKYVHVRPPMPIENRLNISVDIYRGGFLAVDYLAGMGHRRIALLCSQIANHYMLPRFLAYQKVLENHNITFDWNMVKEVDCQFGADMVAMPMEELLALKNPPTAIFVTTDNLALKVFNWCKENQIKIPEYISVCGYGNIEEATLTVPTLTSIDPNLDKVGANAVQMLLSLLVSGKSHHLKNRKISPVLIQRESVRKI